WGSHFGAQNWQNAYNPAANYGNSNFDVRNAFKGYILYQLPFGRGRQFLNSNSIVDAILGGWQISDTLVIQSGQPFTPVMNSDTSSGAIATGSSTINSVTVPSRTMQVSARLSF